MVETYQPLANELGRAIEQPVNLSSATDFVTFHTRTLNREYDLVLTAPHLAWLAWKEGGYRPMLTYLEPARGVLIVRADSPYQQIMDLRGKTIALPDPLAVVNIRMEKMLEKAGLLLGRDLTRIDAGSHTNAATHVNQGQADAAVVGVLAYLRLPKEVRDNLRIIAETPAMPSHVFLVHPRTTPARERAIAQAIEQFTRSEVGQAFLQKGGFGGVRALKKNELKQVEGDARELKGRFEAQTHSDGAPR
jgi:phosphonate transport system substrate-binding protein